MNDRQRELSEALETVRRLRQAVEAKVSELDQALERVRDLTGRDAAAGEGGQPSPAMDASEVSEGLRTLILQMTASGRDPEEIARRLENEFGIADSSSIVAAVLERG